MALLLPVAVVRARGTGSMVSRAAVDIVKKGPQSPTRKPREKLLLGCPHRLVSLASTVLPALPPSLAGVSVFRYPHTNTGGS